MLFSCLFVLTWVFPVEFAVDIQILATMALGVLLLFAVASFSRTAHTKRFLVRSLGKQLVSLFSSVESMDFFLATVDVAVYARGGPAF